jgi:hypothetical protein
MNFYSATAIAVSLISCAYAIRRRAFFYFFAFFSIFFLGVAQVELLLATEAFNIIDLFVFNVEKSSLEIARIIFALINIAGFILLAYSAAPKYNNNIDKFMLLRLNSKGFALILVGLLLSFFSLLMSAGTHETGRPTFSGIGIALGLLLPISTAQILISQGKLHKITGIVGIFTILIFSRILALVALIAMFFFGLKILQNKLPSTLKLIFLGFTSLMLFFMVGQFKHLIGSGVAISDAYFLTLDVFNWISDISFGGDRANLGLATTYTIGIELGAELADCVFDKNNGIHNLIYTINDFFAGSLPGFIRSAILISSENAACNSAIVTSVLVDFIRSFGLIGTLFFSFFLWGYVSRCEIIANNAINTFQLYRICLLSCFSIFLIRGSIGAFVAFFIATFVGLVCVRLCLIRSSSDSSPR